MRYIIGFLVTVGLIVFIIVLLFRGGGSNTPVTSLNLPKYSSTADSQAEYIVDGPIQSDQAHRQLKVDVSEISITMTIYQGYDQNSIYSETIPNNRSAYNSFLSALQLAGFTKLSTPIKGDEVGQCPMGNRYVMSFNDGTKQQMRSWSTTCGGGTFKGIFSTVSYLFKGQVPNYDEKASPLSLY